VTKPYIKIACRADGRLTGEAYVRFDSMSSAQEAQLKYDKKEIGKRYVELFIVDPSEADHVLSIS
jgi:heterogeneous nuclear ribonucleoprotein F/H